MFSLASKVLFALTATAVAMAVGYGYAVDERAAVAIFVFVAVAAATVAVALGGATVPDVPPVVPDDAPPPQREATVLAPTPPGTGWTVGAAGALALLAVGAAVSWPVVVGGAVLAALATGGWLAASWRLHPSWTPRVRSRVSARLLLPLGLPLATVGLALLIAISVSRILLAVSKNGAVVIALLVAIAIFGGCAWVAARPRLSSSALLGLGAVAMVSMLGAGIAGAVAGEREFHREEEDGVIRIAAAQVTFDRDEIVVTEGQEVVMEFANHDDVFHNVAVYQGEGPEARPVFNGRGFAGEDERTYRFTAPAAGTYTFVCDFHENMKGAFVVQPPGTATEAPEDHGE